MPSSAYAPGKNAVSAPPLPFLPSHRLLAQLRCGDFAPVTMCVTHTTALAAVMGWDRVGVCRDKLCKWMGSHASAAGGHKGPNPASAPPPPLRDCASVS